MIIENVILNFTDEHHEKKKIKLLKQYEELENNLTNRKCDHAGNILAEINSLKEIYKSMSILLSRYETLENDCRCLLNECESLVTENRMSASLMRKVKEVS